MGVRQPPRRQGGPTLRRHIGARDSGRRSSPSALVATRRRLCRCGSDDDGDTSATAAPSGSEPTAATRAPQTMAGTAAPAAGGRATAGHRSRHGHQLARPQPQLLRHVPDLQHRGVRDADHRRSRRPQHDRPRLATSWEGNADNTVFTFTLDPAATFADGSPVEATDVKWTWERLANIQGSASYLMSGY